MRSIPILAVAALASVPLAAQQKAAPAVPKKAQRAARAIRLVGPGRAKPLSQAELRARYDKKLKSPWLATANWTTDYDEARQLATGKKKLIFAYFTRSYAP